MKIEDITDFLPKYPNISNYSEDFLNPYDENFNLSIFKKKEFYDNKLNAYEDLPKKGELLKSQKTIANFFSSHTPYDRMLLIWEMGVGKTCAAVGAIEQIRKEKSTLTGAIILVRGKGLIDNFKDELVKKCTDGVYIPKGFKNLSEGQKVARINKLVAEYYTFYKFFEMGKTITYMTDEQIIEEFSNKIIIIDEVHNIRLKEIIKHKQKKGEETIPKETIYVYKQIHRMLHLVKNCKILIMSGTPIKDKIPEFANIMNLILPIDEQLPTKQKFLNDYFNFDEELPELERTYIIKKNKVKYLKSLLKGKVSYLKAISSTVKKEFIGDKNVGGLKHFIVYKNFMNSNKIKFGDTLTSQSDIYKTTFEQDKKIDKKIETDNIYLDSRQASLFVFPDGTYGNKGFNKWITKNKNIKLASGKRKGGEYYSYSLNPELKKLILEPDDDENFTKSLLNLKKYSTKYASVIKNILKASKEKKSSFVYCSLVEGSGAMLFSFLLELFGFSKASSGVNTKAKRYAFFTSDTGDADIKKIRDRFNNPDNLYGEYINVIIGSKLISEGYSFKNIQEEHILTPHWNYAETAQAIARGYRFGSHKDLIDNQVKLLALKNGINPEKYVSKNKQIDFKLLSEAINTKLGKAVNSPLDIVKPVLKIYQYVSIPTKKRADGKSETQTNLSIDILMYKRSEIKDFNIKHIERLIKESAFDCALNYDRNFREGYDNQVECDYTDCEYTCDGIPSNLYKESKDEYDEEQNKLEEQENYSSEEEGEEEDEVDEDETDDETEEDETDEDETDDETDKDETDDETEEETEEDELTFKKNDYVLFTGYNKRSLDAFGKDILIGEIMYDKPDNVGRYIVKIKDIEQGYDDKLAFEPNDLVKLTKEQYNNPKLIPKNFLDKIEENRTKMSYDSMPELGDIDSGENNINLDYSTYQLYYNNLDIKNIITSLSDLFKHNFELELNSLLNSFKNYTSFEVVTTLRDIINNNIIIHDKYNFPRYLRENNNIYFLVDNITVEGSYLLKFYTENPILNVDEPFDKILDDTFANIIPKIIVKIFETDEPDKIKKILSKLPTNVIELIIENSILSKLKDIQKNKIQRDVILNFYKTYYKKYKKEDEELFWICTYSYYDTNILRCLKDINEGWVNCTENDIAFYNKQKEEEEDIIKKGTTNPYGYYGKFNGDNFCISEVDEEALKEYEKTGDARLLKTGGRCNQGKFQKGNLWNLIINIFNLPLPSDTRKDIPNNLQYWKEINDLNSKKKIDYIKNSKYFTEVLADKDIDNKDEDEINRLYYWIRQSGDVKCKMLREFLEEKNLLFKDPNCGVQTKTKTTKKTDKDVEKEKKVKKSKSVK